MKKSNIKLAVFVLLAITLTSSIFVKNQINEKPKSTYQVGSSKVVVWENKSSDGKTWKSFKVEKIYKKDEKWESTNNFKEEDLLNLKAALDKTINEEIVNVK